MTYNLSPAMADALARALLSDRSTARAGPVPKDVQAYWRAKKLRPAFSHQEVWREEHDHAFTVAKVLRLDVLEAVQDELERAIVAGVPFAKWQKEVRPRLEKLGWWAPHEVEDPETGEAVTVDPPKRLKLIYDTNLRVAHAVGQYDRLVQQKATRPYWLYGIGPSKRHRDQHVAWAGLLLPVDDPFWEVAFPPNGFGCHCHVKGVSKAEYRSLVKNGIQSGEAAPILDEDGLPTGHVEQKRIPVQLEAPMLPLVAHTNKRTGKTVYVPEGIQPGFDRTPGEGRKLVEDEGKRRISDASRSAPKRSSTRPRNQPQNEQEVPPTASRTMTPLEKRRAAAYRKKAALREAAIAARTAAPTPTPSPPAAAPKAKSQKRASAAPTVTAEVRVPPRGKALLSDINEIVGDYVKHIDHAVTVMPKADAMTYAGKVPDRMLQWARGVQNKIVETLGTPEENRTPLEELSAQTPARNLVSSGHVSLPDKRMALRITTDKNPAIVATFIHELVHMVGGAANKGYRGAAIPVEESVTEEIAATMLGKTRAMHVAPKRVDLADPKKAHEEWMKPGAHRGEWAQSGTYRPWRDHIYSAVSAASGEVDGDRLHQRVLGAMILWKREVYDEPKKAVAAFVEALKPTSEAERKFLELAFENEKGWGERR